MSDLISRRAAIDAVSKGCQEWRGIFQRCEENIKAIEAEPKHGRWKAWDLTWGRSIYVCTSCGDAMEVPTENGKPIFNYCPYCGARMDEVEE